MARIIDGKKLAADIQTWLGGEIVGHQNVAARPPHLSVILIGEDPASKLYVAHKEHACKNVGITSTTIHLDEEVPEHEVLELVEGLNTDPTVDGILLQLPAPPHIDALKLMSAVDVNKDVDGLSPYNQGLLNLNQPLHIPCTAKGILRLIKSTNCEIKGKHAVVVGRSALVGSPTAQLLLHNDASVTVLHSRSADPAAITRTADILVVAAGVAKLVDSTWVKEGAVVIDVGIHRSSEGLCGDVDFNSVKDKAAWITPVPGGVGPMTIT